MDFVTCLEVLVTVVVVGFQRNRFSVTRAKAHQLGTLFPAYQPLAIIKTSSFAQNSHFQTLSTRPSIEPAGPASSCFLNILRATDRYLEANSGAPADFKILQDIAERVS